MRRFAFIAALAAALGLSAPGAVLAKGHSSHHSRHQSRSRSHHKAAKARTVHLTPASVNSGSNGATTTPASDSIGTVAGFDTTTHMLTINLNDGTTVSGLVDPNATEFECVAPTSSGTAQTASMRDEGGSGSDGGSGSSSGSGSGDGQSGDTSGSDDQSSTQPSSTPTSAPQSGDDNGQEADDTTQDNEANDQNDPSEANEQDGQDGQAAAGCDSSLLVAPQVVREADLRITPSGSTFHKLVLVH
jgi:hypothetical protein